MLIRRVNGSPVEVARPHALTVTAYDAQGQAESKALLFSGGEAAVSFERIDPEDLVLPDSGDETWAKIRLDAASLERVPTLLARLGDPVARAVTWGALREGLLDATVDPELFVRTIEQALPEESDLTFENVLLKGAVFELGRYFAAAGDRGRLSAVAVRLLEWAAPASNRQLIAVRALIALTEDAALLRGWLSGDTTPSGLVADEDFRWRLTKALCALGQFDRDHIAAERWRDPSSQGALPALRCHAALPDPSSKAEVWRLITTDDGLSNYEVYALAESFFRNDQVELTAAVRRALFHGDAADREDPDRMDRRALHRSGVSALLGRRVDADARRRLPGPRRPRHRRPSLDQRRHRRSSPGVGKPSPIQPLSRNRSRLRRAWRPLDTASAGRRG